MPAVPGARFRSAGSKVVPPGVVIVSVAAMPDVIVTVAVCVTVGGTFVIVELTGAGVTVARRKDEQSCFRTEREGLMLVDVPVTARAQLS